MIVQDVMVVMTGENLPPGERVERQLAVHLRKGENIRRVTTNSHI